MGAMSRTTTRQLDRTVAELARVMHLHREALAASAVGRPGQVPEPAPTTVPGPLDRLLAGTERRFGLQTSETLRAKLAAALRSATAADVAAWLDRLGGAGADDPDWLTVVECLTVHETYLFRDWEQLEFLRDAGLRRIVGDGGAPRALRLWSAGCASGEEAFSLAVICLEALLAAGIARETVGAIALPADWRVEVLGTDVSRLALAQARTAIYETGRLSSFRAVPPPLLRFFPAADGLAEGAAGNRAAREDLRPLVRFERHNLMDEQPPAGGAFDVVACRNVLIYFAAEARARTLRMLEQAVRPGGLLLLGPTDPAPSGRFAPVHGERCVLYRRRR
jgi:chemotaxis protein methyltransferase CheR